MVGVTLISEAIQKLRDLVNLVGHWIDRVAMAKIVPRKCILPPEGRWTVFIERAKTTREVYFRLRNYAVQYSNLLRGMRSFYAQFASPVSEVVVGEFYATEVEGDWARVQVLREEKRTAHVTFVDSGLTGCVAFPSLREVPQEYLDVPIQAVRCQLAGLEGLVNDLEVIDLLQRIFASKWFVAEVEVRDPELTVTLYDARTGLINMNARLVKTLSAPMLPEPGAIVHAHLSHIDLQGSLSVQLHRSRVDHLLHLMDIVGNHIMENNVPPSTSLYKSSMYACRERSSLGFCRALLLSAPVRPQGNKLENSSQQVHVRLVDIGKETFVPVTDLYELEVSRDILREFPHQAVSCRLAGFAPDHWTPKAAALLTKLAPLGLDLLLKVVEQAEDDFPASVELYKLSGQKELISINGTMAYALDSSDDSNLSGPPSPRPSNHRTSQEQVKFQLSHRLEEKCAEQVPRWRPASPVFRFGEEMKVTGTDRQISEQKVCQRQDKQKIADVATSGASGDFLATSKLGALTLTSGPDDDSPDMSSPMPLLSDPMADLKMSPMQELKFVYGKSLPVPELPDIGQYMDVYITEAANPESFVCQLWCQREQLKSLTSEMQSYYAGEGSSHFPGGMPESLLRKGHYFAAFTDNQWYRALVQKVQGPMALAYFVDHGFYGPVNPPDLQPLWQRFRLLPVQTFQASLAGVKAPRGGWTERDCAMFQGFVKEKKLVARIASKEPDTKTGIEGAQHLNVVLIDAFGRNDIEKMLKQTSSRLSST